MVSTVLSGHGGLLVLLPPRRSGVDSSASRLPLDCQRPSPTGWAFSLLPLGGLGLPRRSGARLSGLARRWLPGLALVALLSVLPAVQPVRAEQGSPPDVGQTPLRSWHFAEGNGHHEFQTFFTIVNLSAQPAGVTASYHRDDGIRLVQWLGIEPRARLSLNASDVVGARAFGASFTADQDIVVERSTTWGPNQNAATTLGYAPENMRGWHFAEGTTRGQRTTFFVAQNLGDAPANVVATFTRDDSSRETRSFTLAPRARDAYRMNDLMPNTAFAASFAADQDIVVERTIMIEGDHPAPMRRRRDDDGDRRGASRNGRAGNSATAEDGIGILGGLGYAAAGADVGSRSWEFAEGSTRRPYLTYFVLFNPSDEAAEVRFRFRPASGEARTHILRLPALGRVAFDPRDVVPEADFGTSIMADRPIIAERSYYSTGDGLYGALGYTPPRARGQARAWYFADGNTTGDIETYFVLANLTDQPAQVRASYFADDGQPRDHAMTVPAGGRLALRANDVISGRTFAARFVADRDIVAEHTTYFPGGSGFSTPGTGVGRR